MWFSLPYSSYTSATCYTSYLVLLSVQKTALDHYVHMTHMVTVLLHQARLHRIINFLSLVITVEEVVSFWLLIIIYTRSGLDCYVGPSSRF